MARPLDYCQFDSPPGEWCIPTSSGYGPETATHWPGMMLDPKGTLICDYTGNCVWVDTSGHYYHQYTVLHSDPSLDAHGATLPVRTGVNGGNGDMPGDTGSAVADRRWIGPVLLIGLALLWGKG